MNKKQKQIFRILLRMASKRGINVIVDMKLPKGLNGFWTIKENEEYIVLNEQIQDKDSLNFIFAHELGHSVLHKGKINNALYQANNWKNEYQKALEKEADEFAHELIAKVERVVS